MKIGAWIHDADDAPLDRLIADAARGGVASLRCYSIDYAEKAAPALADARMSLLGGLDLDGARLAEDWRSQVKTGELARYFELGIPLEALCVGNELREGGDEPGRKRFTARLSFGLARVLEEYRGWMAGKGVSARLSYAMEGIVLEADGSFKEHLRPLIDACDIVCLNFYPMTAAGWFGWGAFEESRRFLRDARVRHLRFADFTFLLRMVCEQLLPLGKRVILSETGFPSAVGYRREGEGRVIPVCDGPRHGEAMQELFRLLDAIDRDYDGMIEAAHIYEWRDNPHHSKISNVEQSPIHAAFGLCDREGKPRFDTGELLGRS